MPIELLIDLPRHTSFDLIYDFICMIGKFVETSQIPRDARSSSAPFHVSKTQFVTWNWWLEIDIVSVCNFPTN